MFYEMDGQAAGTRRGLVFEMSNAVNMPLSGCLYVVGTPLGNDGDFSLRALEILNTVDLIACEDTRSTGLLLSRFDIRKPRISYHMHNLRARENELLERLLKGAQIALVSDAGMPAISDPGADLVQACVREGIKVSVVPGPSAVTSALAVSALDTRRFIFEGFLEVKGKARQTRLSALASETRTMVLYEAPHRLKKTLEDLAAFGLGPRRLCVAREMTKRYEEFLYLTVEEALAHYSEHEPRGEFVLVLEGSDEALAHGSDAAPASGTSESDFNSDFDTEAFVRAALSEGQKTKRISRELSTKTGLALREAYDQVQRIKERQIGERQE